MKKVVSIIAIILTVCVMMSVALIPAFAIRDKEGKLPLATSAIATIHSGMAQAGATVNETNSATYIIIAAGIFVVAMGLGILIGYNIKKKKPALAEQPKETE